ncbi:Ankyrin repeat domain-containing protein 1 [Hondaea fermentalgiana]|uniref:Ankyrin repeat domain-containing protein 1 n=1 Tax=Hondaea fermentalgiana TaxID=2315210 RepID=A0A2R5G858_9STRA|nr:Ankyrin repeat domain-containing protein 1 [Hondaea fermentalgiana]|eukprot:GBG27246.1 Ankyrin repeat domain-containing protein 1 [Hondaea fermentalgiana]
MVMYNEPQPDLVLSKPAPKLKPTVKDEDLSPAELLMRGGSLWKIACNPTVHTGIAKRKWFKIVIPRGAGPDEALLEWHDPERAHKRPRSIPMNRVVKVLTGHQTKPFFAMQACDLPPARLSFSLLLPERSLDLAALREDDLKIWLEGLCYYACNASVKQIWTADRHVDSGSIPFGADGRSEHKIETVSEELLFDLFDAAYENQVIAFEQILGGNNLNVDTLEPGVAYGDSCLVIASQRGYTKIAEICLRYGAANDPHPDYGQTALQAAVSHGQMVCAKLLLETAAPSKMDTVIVNETDQKGSAPIHLACHLKDRNLIQLLLKHGADMTIVDKKGRTVLHCAILTRTAAQKGRAQETVQCLRMLLDQGADEFVNVQDDAGNTALHFAVQTGNAEIVRVLLESAGNPLITNADGFQPYHVAISRNATACLTLLREYESWFSAHEAATASRRAATSKMEVYSSLEESKAGDATSTVKDFSKYVQMRKFGIAEAAVRQKMLMDGITDEAAIAKVLATPAQLTTGTEPETKKAALTKALSERGVGRKMNDEGGKEEVVAHNGPSAEEAMEKLEAMECFGKYKKMKKMGIPPPAIKQKMMKDGLSNDIVTLFEIAFKIAAPPALPSGKRPTNRRSRSVLKLHWNTLQVDSVENTVWATKASTAALPDEDLKDLEELFAAKKATKKVLTSSTRLIEKSKRRSTVSSKRENNVGIGLAQFRKAFASMDEIGLAIDAADAERLGGARAQLLLDLLPDAEETRELERALSRMSEASFLEEATPVERFFVSILKISQVKRKVQGIVFEQQFGDLQKELETRLGTMLRGCEEIQSSKRLQQVFKMILDIGNYMNEGDEAGFTLDSLLKLGETRAADRKTTVIDYLCKVAHRKGGDELLHVDDELKSIEAASKLLPSDLLQRAKKLASELDNAERLIASEEENDAASVYAGAMKPRLALIRPQVTALVTRAESMIAATRDAVSYFGENPDACTPQHMLKVLHKFLLLFRDSRRKFLHKLKLERRRQDKLDAQAAQSR